MTDTLHPGGEQQRSIILHLTRTTTAASSDLALVFASTVVGASSRIWINRWKLLGPVMTLGRGAGVPVCSASCWLVLVGSL